MVNNTAHKWREFGAQLLRPDQENMLDIIAANYPHDVVSCCICVLKKWLDTTADATWNELIRALRSPSVQLDNLAGQLEWMLITECKITELACRKELRLLVTPHLDPHCIYCIAILTTSEGGYYYCQQILAII